MEQRTGAVSPRPPRVECGWASGRTGLSSRLRGRSSPRGRPRRRTRSAGDRLPLAGALGLQVTVHAAARTALSGLLAARWITERPGREYGPGSAPEKQQAPCLRENRG